MFPGNYDLQEYYNTPQGQFVFRVLSRRIKQIWPVDQQKDMVMAGFGYTFPYLDLYAASTASKSSGAKKKPLTTLEKCTDKVDDRKESKNSSHNEGKDYSIKQEKHAQADRAPSLFSLVSRHAGLYYWPQDEDNRVVLCRRSEWPFPKQSIDRILVVHDGEYASGLEGFLNEVWRVLKPNGRLLMVLPNRTGMWARSDKNPFGHGAPYSLSQMQDVLRQTHFVYEGANGALLTPPFRSKSVLNIGGAVLEPCGRFCPAMAGVQLIEASKRIYAPTGKKEALGENIRKLIWPAPAGNKPMAG